jgi:hypothetical protein
VRPTPTLPRMVPGSEVFRARWHRPDTPAPFDCSGEITLTGEQILGFVCRGFWDGKQHFRERLPFAPFPQKGASQEPTVFFFHRNPMHGARARSSCTTASSMFLKMICGTCPQTLSRDSTCPTMPASDWAVERSQAPSGSWTFRTPRGLIVFDDMRRVPHAVSVLHPPRSAFWTPCRLTHSQRPLFGDLFRYNASSFCIFDPNTLLFRP